jgi:hypothetical protein
MTKGRSLTRILDYLRHHAIAVTALGCSILALAGASYAAISIPNGSITASKLNQHSIGGYVLAWAHVRSDGRVLSGSPGATAAFASELTDEPPPPGDNYSVGWRGVKVPGRCAAAVTIDDNGPLSSRGATAEADILARYTFVGSTKTHGQVQVDIANSADQNVPDNFYVTVVC